MNHDNCKVSENSDYVFIVILTFLYKHKVFNELQVSELLFS